MVEAVFYSLVQLRIAQYEEGVLTLKLKTLIKLYFERGFLVEIIGLIPLNLITGKRFKSLIYYVGLCNIEDPIVLISILRLNRIILLTRVNGILALVTTKYPKIMKFISVLKPLGFLFFIWHLTSCMWMWFNLAVA